MAPGLKITVRLLSFLKVPDKLMRKNFERLLGSMNSCRHYLLKSYFCVELLEAAGSRRDDDTALKFRKDGRMRKASL